MDPDTPDADKSRVARRPRSKPWFEGRARSLAGIHGIAARPAHPPAVLAAAPTTSDIRKARQMAARTRALSACNACKTARYLVRPVCGVSILFILTHRLALLAQQLYKVPKSCAASTLTRRALPEPAQGQMQRPAAVPALHQARHRLRRRRLGHASGRASGLRPSPALANTHPAYTLHPP